MALGIRRVQRANMFAVTSFITGHAEESEEDHRATIDLIRLTKPYLADINPPHGPSGQPPVGGDPRPPPAPDPGRNRQPVDLQFPNQLDKKTIKRREVDFRQTYTRLWRNPVVILGALRIIRANRIGVKLARSLLTNPLALLQMWRAGKPR